MSGLLADLRALVPLRPLTMHEAMFLADRQASEFLTAVGVEEAPVPSEAIEQLRFVRVHYRRPMQSSGAARWMKPRWVVLINANEPAVRQRFSLAHEFKHIVDHVDAPIIYADRRFDPAAVERVCDYFAGCLLMPRTWLRDAFVSGVQELSALAELFEVSQAAMQVRLTQLGLTDVLPRCAPDVEPPQYLRTMRLAA